MSAITGIWFRDGRPVDMTDIEAMLTSMASRGPDGTNVWSGRAVGLGHAMLYTTPESLTEKLPLHINSPALAITADARIDNRDELIEALCLKKKNPTTEIADSELILRAYQKWGDECPVHLIGDFAFAIWDGKKQRLFCARDHLGAKPLFYHKNHNGMFAFASEIGALLTLPEVPRRLNESMIPAQLSFHHEDVSRTFYKDIARLAPAHTLTLTRTIGRGGLSIKRYWSPDPKRKVRLSSDDEYGEAFHEHFTEAVRCRLRSAYPVGSELSGGLDSSSISCIAARLLKDTGTGRLHTFTASFTDDPKADESRYVDSVLRGINVDPCILKNPDQITESDIESFILHRGEPIIPSNVLIQWPLYKNAKDRGVRVMLDGLDGDTTVLHGVYYPLELLSKARLGDFSREIKALAKNTGVSPWQAIKTYVLAPIAPPMAHSIKQFIQRRQSPKCGYNVVSPHLPGRFAFNRSMKAAARDESRLYTNTRALHRLRLTAPGLMFNAEARDAAAAIHSLELRHPFFDKRLVEFCLSLPPSQSLGSGWTRVVLRRAMKGILPEDVRLRTTKANTSVGFQRSLLATKSAEFNEILNGLETLNGYACNSALGELNRHFTKSNDGASGVVLWRALVLASWLRQNAFAPGTAGAERKLLNTRLPRDINIKMPEVRNQSGI